ncbi:MAG: type VI secretion system baseplate subunit TssK [Acetobacteraceae bacterium]
MADIRPLALGPCSSRQQSASRCRSGGHGVRVGPIQDRTLLVGSSFVLVVQADVPADTLRRSFPSTVKIGAVEHIRELVNVALPGIELNALPVAPRQMPFVCRRDLLRTRSQQPRIGSRCNPRAALPCMSRGDFPNLVLDLWAIRG